MANVTIYSTPTCAYCKMSKEYFKANNIDYKEVDVAANPQAAEEMVNKSGQMGVPVIVVENEGKEDVIVGFDQAKLAQAIGI